MPQHAMRVILLIVLCACRALRSAAIQLAAPGRCAGTRTVTHASALFGRPLDAGAEPFVRSFAPLPRANDSTDAADARALDDLCGAAPLPAAARGRIVLALRGGCDFATKVWHAERAGAVGVVVVNRKRIYQLVNMKLNETLVEGSLAPPVTLPTVMIRYYDWHRVSACRDALRVSMTADGEAVYDIDYGRDALNWAMMRGLALWILCQFGVNMVRYKRRASALRTRASTIAKMGSHPFGCHEDDRLLANDANVCAVCLHGFVEGQVVRRLRCAHTFHKECIDPWLQASSNSCPICKRSVSGLDPPPNVSYGASG